MSSLGSKIRSKWEDPYKRLSQILNKEIWETGNSDQARLTRTAYYLLRILSLIKTGFGKNNVFVRGAALCYSSLLALGPLAAIALLIGGFLLNRIDQEHMVKLMNDFVEFLAPPLKNFTDSSTDTVGSQMLINEKLITTLDNFIESAQSGAFGVLGILFLILIAIQLFTAVEKAFNDIWGVRRGRSWLQRIVFYWTFLSLGALLSFTSLAIYSAGTYVQVVEGLPLGEHIMRLIRWLTPLLSFFLILVLLTSFYRFIPNTQVYFVPALSGAFIVSVLLVLNNYLSFLYVKQVVNAQSLYGSLGIVSILMLALYIFWIFVLVGGQITYAIQNVNFLANQQAWENTSRSTREVLSMAALILIARRFKECLPAYSSTELSKRLRVPGQILNESLSHLMDMGFISVMTAKVEKSEITERYQPAKPLEKITLYQFKKSLDDYGNSEGKELILNVDPLIREFHEKAEGNIYKDWHARSLEDLLQIGDK